MSGAVHRPSDVEASTIEACRRGDRRALEALFRVEAPRVERLIARLIGPSSDVKDLLQTSLMAAIDAFPRFRGEASVRTWLARITVRIVHEHLRRPQKRRATLRVLRLEDQFEDRAPAPDHVADSRRALERLHEHLGAIGPKQRIAFLLHVVEGKPIDEVAALMSATKTATKSRVFFARRSLFAKARGDAQLRHLVADRASGAEVET
jgi:RNA polymerase sigma-70 factor (ECF subfamily)